MWNVHSALVNKLYKPCMKSSQNKKFLQIVHTLSFHKDFQKHCFRLIDKIFGNEYKIHQNSSDSLKCLLWNENASSFLSSWINDVFERNQVFSKLNRNIIKCFELVSYMFPPAFFVFVHMFLRCISFKTESACGHFES